MWNIIMYLGTFLMGTSIILVSLKLNLWICILVFMLGICSHFYGKSRIVRKK